ncbi:hypothetical protein AVEN_171969-1 [Araneus ventricosus]|uniref:Uncharacterized protein n=1 Tax=Araneus ventricosus TaxID=182803 RepID=A0A4Y2T7N2_ARAVE|nr:hypothetical protein AVEN_55956-1 [Araneus ventricosus]GBN96635.1 hypothetical protein AVEN_171969-1 [Araneus ventricosus]
MQLEFPSQPKSCGTPDGETRSGPAQHDSTNQHLMRNSQSPLALLSKDNRGRERKRRLLFFKHEEAKYKKMIIEVKRECFITFLDISKEQCRPGKEHY